MPRGPARDVKSVGSCLTVPAGIAFVVRQLTGTIALVAGATRGASRAIAAELGAEGATVYVMGCRTREQRSDMDRALCRLCT